MCDTITQSNDYLNETYNNKSLLLRQCLVLLSSYNNCLIVMSNNCKCEPNIQIKQLSNDLSSKYKFIITNNTVNIKIIEELKLNLSDLDNSVKYKKYSDNEDLNENIGFDQTNIDSKQYLSNNINSYRVCNRYCKQSLETITDNQLETNDCNTLCVHLNRKHKNIKHQNICDDNLNQTMIGKSIKLNTNNNHKQLDHKTYKTREYTCDWKHCKYSTKFKRCLLIHKNRHMKLKAYHCDWPSCGSSFVTNSELSRHTQHTHIAINFSCVYCSKKCKTKTSLKYHIMNKHTNDKQFVCNLCDKGFVTNSRLNAHVKESHTEKMLKCDDCDHRSDSVYHLNIHKRRVHLRERTFKCDIDGCEGKSFFSKRDLVSHQMSVHSDERKFVCDYPNCGASFKLKTNLTVHIKTHSARNILYH